MSWLIAIGLALAVWASAALLFRLARGTWLVLASALAVGLAGYAAQATPGIPARPAQPASASADDGAALVEAREPFFGMRGGNDRLILANAFARHGQFANAAGVLRSVVNDDPGDAEAWLALANALVAHADGALQAPALYAYRRADEAAPDNAGPAFFLGVMHLRAGRLIEAHQLWTEALADSPPDAPWRADLEQRVSALERLLRQIAEQ